MQSCSEGKEQQEDLQEQKENSPKSVPRWYIKQIRIPEETGTQCLGGVMTDAQYIKNGLRKSWRGADIYLKDVDITGRL